MVTTTAPAVDASGRRAAVTPVTRRLSSAIASSATSACLIRSSAPASSTSRMRTRYCPFHLRARRPDRRASAGIQQAKLNPDRIGHLAHDPAERVDFADQVALGDSADRRIARHLRDQVQVHRHHRRSQAHSGTRARRFAARVTGTDNDHVVLGLHPSVHHLVWHTQEKMKILVIGSGGREHALCWKLKQSTNCSELFAAPGNPALARCLVSCDARLLAAAESVGADLTVVGPEGPLTKA